MADLADYTEFWVACAAAGPVLLIPTYLLVRQERSSAPTVRSGMSLISVLFLAAGTVYALVMLSSGTPVHGKQGGRVIELVLICAPVVALATSLLRRGESHDASPPRYDESGLPEID